jgi:hypothetical protein
MAVVPPPAARSAGAPDAKPIPGGFSRNFKPVPSNGATRPSHRRGAASSTSSRDFDGFVAAAEIQGKARGSDG